MISSGVCPCAAPDPPASCPTGATLGRSGGSPQSIRTPDPAPGAATGAEPGAWGVGASQLMAGCGGARWAAGCDALRVRKAKLIAHVPLLGMRTSTPQRALRAVLEWRACARRAVAAHVDGAGAARAVSTKRGGRPGGGASDHSALAVAGAGSTRPEYSTSTLLPAATRWRFLWTLGARKHQDAIVISIFCFFASYDNDDRPASCCWACSASYCVCCKCLARRSPVGTLQNRTGSPRSSFFLLKVMAQSDVVHCFCACFKASSRTASSFIIGVVFTTYRLPSMRTPRELDMPPRELLVNQSPSRQPLCRANGPSLSLSVENTAPEKRYLDDIFVSRVRVVFEQGEFQACIPSTYVVDNENISMHGSLYAKRKVNCVLMDIHEIATGAKNRLLSKALHKP